MTLYDRHLQAALGYLELGMPLDANDEIESIKPEMKTLSEVLAVRVEISEPWASGHSWKSSRAS